MRRRAAFCVIERPFVVWSDDVARDNRSFLESVDSSFYLRAAVLLMGSGNSESAGDDDEDQTRKDVSSLARMLWHHGIETLVMLLGAYIQAPHAVHAYFQKCRTEDATCIARTILSGERPAYNHINDVSFSLSNLLMGLHLRAGWPDRDATVDKFLQALTGILSDFAEEEHRWEYNSIKHGLRATHGRFALMAGIEETYGVSPPPEAMQTVGHSRDASFFAVAKPLANATKQTSKINFHMATVTVAWSLEKVICELQILSMLLHNTVSALKIANGDASGTVTFNRPADADAWWTQYFEFHRGAVPTASFSIVFDAKSLKLSDAKDVFASYRRTRAKDQE